MEKRMSTGLLTERRDQRRKKKDPNRKLAKEGRGTARLNEGC